MKAIRWAGRRALRRAIVSNLEARNAGKSGQKREEKMERV